VGQADDMVVVDIDKATYAKMLAKYDKEDFIDNSNGVIVLNGEAESYVSNWHNDVAYKRGYDRADLDNNGFISENEHALINGGADLMIGYSATKDSVSSFDIDMTKTYHNLGRMDKTANMSTSAELGKLSPSEKAILVSAFGMDYIDRVERSDKIQRIVNDIFNGDKPETLSEALSKTLEADKNMDGEVTLKEMVLARGYKSIESFKSRFESVSLDDFKQNRINIGAQTFAKLSDNSPIMSKKVSNLSDAIASANGSVIDTQKSRTNDLVNNVHLAPLKEAKELFKHQVTNLDEFGIEQEAEFATSVEKETLLKAIGTFFKGEIEQFGHTPIEEKQSNHYESVMKNFEFFEDTYMKIKDKEAEEVEEEKERDKEAEESVALAMQRTLDNIDDKEMVDDFKRHIFTERVATISFATKVEEYRKVIEEDAKELDMNKMEKNAMTSISTRLDLAEEMVFLDEFIDAKDITKEEFFSSNELKDEFTYGIFYRDNKDVDVKDDIVAPRKLNQEEWERELRDLYQFYDYNAQKAESIAEDILDLNSINKEQFEYEREEFVTHYSYSKFGVKSYELNAKDAHRFNVFKDILKDTYQSMTHRSILEDIQKDRESDFDKITAIEKKNFEKSQQDIIDKANEITIESLDMEKLNSIKEIFENNDLSQIHNTQKLNTKSSLKLEFNIDEAMKNFKISNYESALTLAYAFQK
jgi:hypothetical protein